MDKKDQQVNLNAIRMLGIQMINQANSGHPGIVLGAAPIMYTLFTKIMNVTPHKSTWFNRDRFVLSAGHGSALLYATLHLMGYNISLADLKEFRQLNSKTPGHPELHHTDGVELTTGPLGQGIGMAVGMAVAETFLAAKFNRPQFQIVDHYTYVLCGDGDLQEGISQEAISFAGKQKLNKLILIHDSNDVQLDDKVAEANVEDMHQRFRAVHWNTILVNDGEDVEAIAKAIEIAKQADKPTYIEVKTVIGRGAPKQGTSAVHGAPLGKDLLTTMQFFNWTEATFHIPQPVYDFYQTVAVTNTKKVTIWEELLKKYQTTYPNEAAELAAALNQNWHLNSVELQNLQPSKPEATRISSGNIVQALMRSNPTMLGGSADLSSSTKIKGLDGNFSSENRTGRNIMYGVREFAMAAINNGMAAHGGVLPVASGFLVFSDYLKPALRLSALMNLQTLYVFTHDSIAVGEDGPTHQPIEQLAMLRAIPNHNLFRPADYAETLAAYQLALEDKNHPSTIILTRQDLDQQAHRDVRTEVKNGAYLLVEQDHPAVTLIATGSEVTLAMQIYAQLQAANIVTNVVSMPNMQFFDKQPVAYQKTVINRDTLRVAIEMGSSYGWAKYVGETGLVFGVDKFGASGTAATVCEAYGFNADKITKAILLKLKEGK